MMPRRKSTKKDAESDHEDSSGPHSSRPDTRGKRKKRKIADSKDAQPKSTALLQFMVDMPVDVLLEIFKHLELLDLMHLSRTSKALRSILMSRTSISVWKQALANDGLPQCTQDLNEPQLAEMMFGRSCDWCGRNVSGQEIIWAARVRACKRCIESRFKLVDRYIGNPGYPVALAELVPSVVIRQKKYIDEELDQEWREGYQSRKAKDDASRWCEARVAERRVISEHAKACKEWSKSRRETHVMLRKAIIIERLKERGWEEELDKLRPRTGPTQLTEVVKACQSDLTESTLAALDDVLDKFMEGVKATRLVREQKLFFEHMLRRLREISRDFSHTLPPSSMFPNTADIYFHPIAKTALSAVTSDEMLEEALLRIQPSLPQIVDDCLKLSKQQLTNLVIDEYTRNNKSFDLSVLTLASTLFHCKSCRSELTLDQAVTHMCKDFSYFRDDSDMKAVRSALDEVPAAHKIQHSISFSLKRLEPFTSVLHSCGFDPNTTTAADMREIDPVLECPDCSNMEQGRITMKWSSVPNHFQLRHQHPTSNMSVMDEPEAEFVRARILEHYQRDTARSKDHICVHCRESGGSMTLLQHVKRSHQIDSPVYGQDVIVSNGAVAAFREYHLWPPKL